MDGCQLPEFPNWHGSWSLHILQLLRQINTCLERHTVNLPFTLPLFKYYSFKENPLCFCPRNFFSFSFCSLVLYFSLSCLCLQRFVFIPISLLVSNPLTFGYRQSHPIIVFGGKQHYYTMDRKRSSSEQNKIGDNRKGKEN